MFGGGGSGEGDEGVSELDEVSQLGGSGEGVGGRDDEVEREEREVEDGDVDRGRRENERHILVSVVGGGERREVR